MAAIDSAGAFRGTITESAIGLTKANHYPQAVLRLEAAEKFIADPAEVKFFQENGEADFTGGWHAWPVEDIIGYFCLFNNADSYTKEFALLSYDQIVVATGWDGTSFDAFSDGTLIGKQVLFRVEESKDPTYPGLKAQWIDAFGADPERKLRGLDTSEIKKLNAKLQMGKPAAKPVVAAKAAPPKPSPAPASGPKPAATSPVTSPTSKPAPANKPPAAKTPPVTKPAEEPATLGLPKAVNRDDAWECVCQNKGDNEDKDVEGAWIAACEEVSTANNTRPTVGEDAFTEKDWAQVRDLVFRDLDIKPKLH
jgi:hypothetical protein